MAAWVKIRGGISPGLELERGEEATVAHSDHVQRLINLGVVDLLESGGYSEPVDAGLSAGKGEEGTAEHGTTPPAPTPETESEPETSTASG